MLEVASREHVRASVQAVEQVAKEFSTPAPVPAQDGTLHVVLCHFQHDGFLTPDLHGFPVLAFDAKGRKPIESIPVLQDMSAGDAVDLADGWASEDEVRAIQSRETTFFLDPGQSTPENPFRLMVSMNDSVDMQVKSALSNISLLLARRRLIAPDASAINTLTLPTEADSADKDATEQVADSERAFGWRAVARQLREQALGQNTPVRLQYAAPVFASGEIADRAPAMRYIYNTTPEIRLAVDKLVSRTTHGLSVGGSGVSEEVLQYARNLIDSAHIEKFLAHAVRDAFVSGNGAISFGDNPATDLRLIDPDSIVEVESHRKIRTRTASGDNWLTNCLHLSGADQVGSQFGISYLEPFITNVAQRCMWLEVLLTARAWGASSSTPRNDRVQQFVRDTPRLALTELQKNFEQMKQILGPVTETLRSPVESPYFANSHLLRNPAPYVSMRNGNE